MIQLIISNFNINLVLMKINDKVKHNMVISQIIILLGILK